MRFHPAVAAALAVILSVTSPTAEHLPDPRGDVILSVSGQIDHTNTNGTADFDLGMLAALPTRTFETGTVWTDTVEAFTGVPLKTLLEHVEAEGDMLRATAINDYSVEIPVSEIEDNAPIVAFLRNGEEMSLRDKGPLWIIYPFDADARYQREVIYSRSIWQLERLEILE